MSAFIRVLFGARNMASPEALYALKAAAAALALALFWSWETLQPFFRRGRGRLRHAGHNLALALLNTVVIAAVFGTATVAVLDRTAERGWGLLPALGLPAALRWPLALVLLDGWMYLWHRANHAVPLLWRFHRVHHADDRMDVTTATRFHPGEHFGAIVLRLGLIPLLGFTLGELLVYDSLVLLVTMFHHANISLGRWDRPLAWLVVTPGLHQVHHSRVVAETNSNYSTVLSLWDRLAGTLRRRPDPAAIRVGLDGYDSPHWQTVPGMLAAPFAADAPRPPVRLFPGLRPRYDAAARR
jgi:sterol desaturase/sphingolipid hydroxylase (fatty acid hydroxylase superfamily)